LVLGQVKVEEKSNEITAIPQLLEVLEVSGCIVTIDAMGCQTEIAAKIIEREAEYVLSLKENQGQLYEDVERLFVDLEDSQYKAYAFDYEKTINKDHGAAWIWNLVERNFPQAVQIVDWYHAVEYLTPIAEAVYGAECPEGKQWLEGMHTDLWEGRVEQVISAWEKKNTPLAELQRLVP
jgi:predicted transposase YbfD/YdcC